MTTIEMKLVRSTANYHLYKVGTTEEKDSFGEIYLAKRNFQQPPPADVTVTNPDAGAVRAQGAVR